MTNIDNVIYEHCYIRSSPDQIFLQQIINCSEEEKHVAEQINFYNLNL